VKFNLLLCFLLLLSGIVFGQDCPPNIGFENGTLSGWKCYAGTIKNGVVVMPETGPINGRHTLMPNTSPQQLDPYGGFPVNSPNGSNYTLRLGNDQTGAEIESVSYDFKIPSDRYSITYYYAVVMNNPNHPPDEQPRFSAKVEDVTGGPATQIYKSSLDCVNHDFVASSGLPGFQTNGSGNNQIQYKDWSPVSLTLIGYAGRTLRFTFTTNDCTHQAHFGYAYLDFEENCGTSLIKGNNYCEGTNEVVLTAPAGFESYTWYTDNFTTQVGTNSTLRLNPIPADGKQYQLIVTPPKGLGCTDTMYTTISGLAQPFKLNINKPEIFACRADGADLTAPDITAGSSADMAYQYYSDPDGQSYVSDPKRISVSGTYYIRGTNTVYGCTDIKPIKVSLADGPTVDWTPPLAVCQPATIDLTKVVTDAKGATISYYSDQLATKPLPNATAINKTGIYYIKATSALNCATIIPVSAVVNQLPVVAPKTVASCPPISLTRTVSDGDYTGNTFQFFYDAACTLPVKDPDNLTDPAQSGTYYYRGINSSCPGSPSTVTVTVYKVPAFTVTDPGTVTYPATVNLTDTRPDLSDAAYTYWYDATASQKQITDYRAVGQSGTYYIKATGIPGGCTLIQPVHVIINAPPEADLVAPNTFTPNGDGVNDFFNPTTTGVLSINYLKIFNRYGKQVYETKQALMPWDGKLNGQMQPVGTYYWIFNCFDIYRKKTITRSGPITIIR